MMCVLTVGHAIGEDMICHLETLLKDCSQRLANTEHEMSLHGALQAAVDARGMLAALAAKSVQVKPLVETKVQHRADAKMEQSTNTKIEHRAEAKIDVRVEAKTEHRAVAKIEHQAKTEWRGDSGCKGKQGKCSCVMCTPSAPIKSNKHENCSCVMCHPTPTKSNKYDSCQCVMCQPTPKVRFSYHLFFERLNLLNLFIIVVNNLVGSQYK